MKMSRETPGSAVSSAQLPVTFPANGFFPPDLIRSTETAALNTGAVVAYQLLFNSTFIEPRKWIKTGSDLERWPG